MAEAVAADDDVTLPREFIHLVSSEANEICNRQLKKTILPEHVFQALQGLGFTSYIEEVRSVLQECKTQAANKRRASTRLENLGIPEERVTTATAGAVSTSEASASSGRT
ncbi:Down-regulator of transcription 1 [Desmophyllum pertusum]|uniref:Protein Dr1 n=1 Tax=Desmophyllum pertusum TaxID=174260 RepID=A0A9W9ZY79_9CNID|nr:Down-regulator of transcription 1 [Desmophyllum pertusum]